MAIHYDHINDDENCTRCNAPPMIYVDPDEVYGRPTVSIQFGCNCHTESVTGVGFASIDREVAELRAAWRARPREWWVMCRVEGAFARAPKAQYGDMPWHVAARDRGVLA